MAEGRRKPELDSEIDGVEFNPKYVARRRASPQWKGHFDKLSEKWGTISSASSSVAGSLPTSPIPFHLWGDLEKQKERGGYPWTHLSHNQEEEVWIDPLKLPRDLSAATIRRRDKSIPREWFHLPEGAEPPSVEELLRESSSDEDEDRGAQRAKSPPLCGRGRSKSRERKLNKHKLASDAQDVQVEYEVVNATQPQNDPSVDESSLKGLSSPFATNLATPALNQTQRPQKEGAKPETRPHHLPKQEIVTNRYNEEVAEEDADSTGCFPLTRRSRSRSKSREKKSGKNSRHQSDNAYALPPRTDFPGREGQFAPPEVNREKKPTPKSIKNKSQRSKSHDPRDEGYEPVGRRSPANITTSKDEQTNPFLLEDISPNFTKEYEDVQPFGPSLQTNQQRYSPLQQRDKERLNQIMIEEELKMEKLPVEAQPISRDISSARANNVDLLPKTNQVSNPFENPEELSENIGTSSEMQKDVEVKERAKQKELQAEEAIRQREKEAKEARNQEEKEEKFRKEREEKEEKIKKAKEREEKLRREKEEKAEKVRKEREEKEEKLRREKEEKLRREKEEKLRREKEEKLRREKEEKLRREKEEKEEKLKREKEEKAEKLRKEKEEKEEKLRREKEVKEEKLRKEREEKLQKEKEIMEEELRKEKIAYEEKLRKDEAKKEKKREKKAMEEKLLLESQVQAHKNDVKVKLEKEALKERERNELAKSGKLQEPTEKTEIIDPKEPQGKSASIQAKGSQSPMLKKAKTPDPPTNVGEEMNPFMTVEKDIDHESCDKSKPSIDLNNPFEKSQASSKHTFNIDKNDWEKIKQELSHVEGEEQDIIFTPFQKDDENLEEVDRLEKQAQDQIAELFQNNTLEKKRLKDAATSSKQNDEYEDVAELSAEELKQKQKEDEALRQQRLKAQYQKEQEELKAKKDAKRKNKRRDKSQDSKLSFSFFSSTSSQKGGDDHELEDLLKPSHSSRHSLETNGSELLDSHSRISKKELAKLEKEAQKEKKRIEKLEKEQQKAEKKEMQERVKQEKLKRQAELAKLAKEQKEEEKRKKQEEKEQKKQSQEERDKKQAELAKLAIQQREEEKRKKEEENEMKATAKKEKERRQAELAKLASEQKEEAKKKKELEKESKEQAQKEREKRQAELAQLAQEQKEEAKRKKEKEKESKEQAQKEQEKKNADLAQEQKEDAKRKKEKEKESKEQAQKEQEKKKAELAQLAQEQKEAEKRRKIEEKEEKDRMKKEQEERQAELARLALEQKDEAKRKKEQEKSEKEAAKRDQEKRQAELAKLAIEQEEEEKRGKEQQNKGHGKSDKDEKHTQSDKNAPKHQIGSPNLVQDESGSPSHEDVLKAEPSHEADGEKDTNKVSEPLQRDQELKIKQQQKEIEDMQMLIKLANEETLQSSDLNERNGPGGQNDPTSQGTSHSNGGQLVPAEKEDISSSRKALNKRSFFSKLFQTKSGKSKSMSNLDDSKEEKDDEGAFEPVVFSASSAKSTIKPSDLSPDENDANKIRPISEHLYEPISGSPKPSPLTDRKDQLKGIVESPSEDTGDSPPKLPVKTKNKRSEQEQSSPEPSDTMATKTANSTPFWKFGSKKTNDEPDLVKNGFHDEEEAEEDEEDMDTSSTGGKDRKSRDRKKKPGLGTKMKSFRIPSPGEVATGYLNSNFHQKNFKQPLVSRSRVEDQDLQRIRQLTVERNTPSELAALSHPFDIPLPKFRKNRSKSNKRDETESDDGGHAPNRLYGTLPRSWREQNLVTGVKENVDPILAKERQELVKTKSPAELAQFHSITDFPVPSKIQNMFSTNKRNTQRQAEKRRHSASSVEETQEGWTKSLPRSWKETKLVTNVKEYQPNEVVKQRQELVSNKKPHELAQIHGFSDFPVPALFKRSRSSSGTRDKDAKKRESRTSSVVSLTRSVGGTLSRGWKDTKLVTKVKVEPDSETLTLRRNLIQAKSPAELSQITSVADFPIPTALEHFWKSDKPKENENTEKKASHKSMSNLEDMYSNLPRALKTEVLVRTKFEDEEVLKKRQKLVETMKPSELASITSISDIPIPSALENIFKSSDKPAPPARKAKDIEEKRTRNRSLGAILTYEGLPESLKAEVLVRSKVEEDPEEVRVRQELVKTKTPAQLASINSFSDFPLPRVIDTMVRPSRRTLKSTKQKDLEKKRSRSWASLPETSSGLFSSLKRDLEVSRVEEPDQEIVRQRREMLKNKSVSDLAQIGSLTDFPVPEVFQNMVGTSKRAKSVEKNRSETPTGKKESLYEKLPASLKQECLVRVKDEDPELQKKRQELTRSKSPTELGNIGSLSDIPIPSPIQNMFHRKSETGSPIPPPRRKDKDEQPKSMYERLPESLKTEVLVRSVVEVDEKVLRQRQEMARSMSPAQLSEIHGFSDFPIPSFRKKKDQSAEREKSQEKEKSAESERDGGSGLYATLPKSLKSEVLVRAKMEDPEVQRQRAEIVKSKSVHELSQITSLSDIPMPAFISKGPRPVERKKRFREKQRSNSAKNLYETLPRTLRSELLVKQTIQDQELLQQRRRMAGSKSVQELSQIHSLGEFPLPGWLSKSKPDVSASGVDSKRTSLSNLSSKQHIYSTMPKSLTQEVLVRTVIQDPTVINQRRALTQSKSVSELAQINSFADFPIPSTLSRMVSRKKDKSRDNESRTETISTDPDSKESGLYATLPRSLKTEVLVRSRVEDPEILRYRKQLAQSKSVGELASIGGLSDFPLPTPIQNLFSGKRKSRREPSKEPEKERERSISSRPGSRGPSNDIYASLPRSLKTELQVRSMQEGDNETLKERRALVESKSPAELGQIHSFSEIPVPRMVEAWLHSSESKKGLDSPQRPSRSAHELRGGGLYDTLPRSLKEPVLVGSTVEDPELAKQRAELTRSKSPSELASIRGLGDIPIPGLWSHDSGRTREKKKKDVKEPPKESNKMGTLTRPCVVRSKIEDPEVLRQRQELQQNKSIHELSKINNVNEIPLPFKIPLPDIPFPQPTKIFTLFKKKPPQEPVAAVPSETGYTPSASPVTNADTTDAELLRFETSSMDMDTHREQDFGYEVIDRTLADVNQLQDEFEGDDELSEREVLQPVGQAPASLRKDMASKHQKSSQSQNQQRLDDQEQLVEQYRGTPERKVPSRNKRRAQPHPASSPRHEFPRSESPPPPLPPKKPGGRREEIIDDYEEDDDEEMEVVPVKGILTLEASNGNLQVRKNEFKEVSPTTTISSSSPLQLTSRGNISPRITSPTSPSFLTEVGYGESPTPPPTLPAKTRVGGGSDTLDRTREMQPHIRIGHESPRLDSYDEVYPVLNMASPALNLKVSTPNEIHESPECAITSTTPLSQHSPVLVQRRRRKQETNEKDCAGHNRKENIHVQTECRPSSSITNSDEERSIPSFFSCDSCQDQENPVTTALELEREMERIPIEPEVNLSTTTDDDVERIQSRPLPAPPAPKRTLKKKPSPKKQETHPLSPEMNASLDESHDEASLRVPNSLLKRTGSGASNKSASRLSMKSPIPSSDASFHTAVQSSMDRTLVDSSEVRRRENMDEDEETLADSIVDSMHSCADTIVASDDDMTLNEQAGDTDMEGDDDPLSEHFHSIPLNTTSESMEQYVRRMQETPTPPAEDPPFTSVSGLDTSSRLGGETQELSRELLEHVGNLRSTLDHMSSKLGTSPQPPRQA